MKFKKKPGHLNKKPTRKDLRKQKRQEKKDHRREYYMKKSKKPVSDDKLEVKTPEINKPKITKPKINPDKPIKTSSSTGLTIEQQFLKEKKEQQKLEKQMSKQRKKLLLQDNTAEDQTIRQMEKLLKLNKRKSKSVPKSFTSEGLDYLLEVCDPEFMKNAATAELDFNEVNDDFEEDLAMMTDSKKIESRGKGESDSEGNESIGMSDEDTENKSLKKKTNKRKSDAKQDDKKEPRDKKMKKIVLSEDDFSDEYSDEEFGNDNTDDSDEFMGGEFDSESDYDTPKDQKKGNVKKKPHETSNDELTEENSEWKVSKFKVKNSKTEKQDPVKKVKIKHKKSEIDIALSSEEFEELSDSEKNKAKKVGKETHKKKKNQDEDASWDENSDFDSNEMDYDDPIAESGEDIHSDVENSEENKDEVWEDIYGRLRSKDGSVITKTEGKYIPPALRAQMESSNPADKKRKELLERLKKQLKGLLNRLTENNMHAIATQIETIYMNNSRHDVNETLTALISDAIATSVATPERLLMEHALLVTVLHANVGTEVGAHFLQNFARKLDGLFGCEEVEDKRLDNVVTALAQLYNFRVCDAKLIYEVLEKLAENFTEKNIECILHILRNVGFGLRKDDPLALKTLILELQKKAASATKDKVSNSRIKFLLDVLLAIKNNNVNKIPNYDTTYSEHLKKISKGFIRKGCYVTQLNIPLEDLLKADERGKWWVVGSAWSGNAKSETKKESTGVTSVYSQKILDLARKLRMNTDVKRDIFCIIMTAENYLDAFEKLLRLGLKNLQERDIVNIMLVCCLQEKVYNPYYAALAQRFCDYDRKYQMMLKYSIWDRVKALNNHLKGQISNLAKLLTHLLVHQCLPLTALKVVEFSQLDDVSRRFVRQILLGILLHKDWQEVCVIFNKVTSSNKLNMFRESLRLFVNVFVVKHLKTNDKLSEEQKINLEERARMIEEMLSSKKF